MDKSQPEPQEAVSVPENRPAPQPKAAHHANGSYESNPFKLFTPSVEAFKLCWANLILLIAAGIGVGLLALVIFGVINFVPLPEGLKAGVNVVLFLGILPFTIFLFSYLSWAGTKVIIEASRGHKLTFKESLPPKASLAWSYFWTSLLTGLAILGGFFLFIVPMFIFMAWFYYSTYLLVDEGVSGVAALKRARELARGRNWDVLGAISFPAVFIPFMLIPFLGTFAYFVISIILIPVMAVRYDAILKLKKQADWENVPTHPLNYVVFILGLIFNSVSTVDSFNQAAKDQTQLEENYKPY